MRKSNLIVLLLLFSVFVFAQTNLVPNPSFETYTTCPTSVGELYRCMSWFVPSTGTPDYFNVCASPTSNVSVPLNYFGNSIAFHGSAYAGIFISDGVFGSTSKKYREYLAVRVKNTLIAGQKYFVTYNVKLSDSSRYASNSIGVYFTNDSISKNNFDTIDASPQIYNLLSNFITDKSNWTRLRGKFLANGSEDYIYIGNFRPDVTNDTIFVGPGAQNWINSYNFSYYYIDNICVSSDSLFCEGLDVSGLKSPKSSLSIKINPNPVTDNINITGLKSEMEMSLFDLNGEKKEVIFQNGQANLSQLKKGIYILKLSEKYSQSYFYKIIKQ